MWKTFEGQGMAIGDAAGGENGLGAYPLAAAATLEACSACAGDYEDPDRTARSVDEVDDEDLGERGEDEIGEIEDERRGQRAPERVYWPLIRN